MADGHVTVVATRLKLRSWLKLPRFFRVNGEIKRQLKTTPGLIGYWLRADFLRLRLYTLSVWENRSAVDAFLRTGAHLQAMAVFDRIAVRGQSRFTDWETSDPEETTWEEACKRLEETVGASCPQVREKLAHRHRADYNLPRHPS